MNTGEDTQSLRKIVEFTRLISIFILSIHFYICCYAAFKQWGCTAEITDRIIVNIAKTGLFDNLLTPKLAALLFLTISLLGVKGKKDEKIQKMSIVAYILSGLILYFISVLCLLLPLNLVLIAVLYISLTSVGYMLTLSGGGLLSRLIKDTFNKDVFNTDNESFPQEERLLENEYSINLPATYNLKGKIRKSHISIINPFRGVLVSGTPGSGKTYFVIRHIIEQHIKKGFSMFIYDFKFDDLSKIAYNKLLQYQGNYKVKPKLWVIDFDKPLHRCNPLDPQSMDDITDATEASRTIMLGLNKEWIKKTGDFFVESPINFLTAVIWYLRKYQNGRYCTLPHCIELIQADYDKLFAVLQEEDEIKALINPFISAYQNKAMAQLEGQIASAKIGLARLASPQLYYVLSGNDFTLDVNNPDAPKIVCMGNNPQKQQIYGAVLSLYVSKMIKLVNRKGQLKSSLIFDEFPSIYIGGASGIDKLLATCRSNLVCCTLAVQNYEQLTKDYGGEEADVIVGVVGNVISGQVTGGTAKKLSENFGKIMQDKQSRSINSAEISISKSTQMDFAIPASKIATLSSGEFVGIVADNPDQKIKLKMFHCEIQNDHKAIAEEENNYKPIPVNKNVSYGDIIENYMAIKLDIQLLFESELEKIAARQQQDDVPPPPIPDDDQIEEEEAEKGISR
ncbi:conjugal transfer protein MobC [Pedobacter gandavensis]|uniref:Type IV secretion system DNA-binding domain-containing protein n=1 Tax=Pedobacter gandavensis TaxID=2679963 RepID=A0ABR6EUM7_9SPHI|nr:conjugal transfer protein MobC [Pedobacter gandavensis]MBB2148967.1 type IV secretion system DNA-binding domain-containing protein [Pedobacter gandavensis]